MFEVIYLTGAPASGKSSLTRRLRDRISGLQVWEFGERLTAHLNARTGSGIAQEELRSRSSMLATPEDIGLVDDQLLAFVETERQRSHIVIDSHPVTKERYGFRVTPYSLERFQRLRPTQIWMLYTSPNVAIERIRSDPRGRPLITDEEARFHTQLQASVAATYGMAMGLAVHLFNADRPPEELDEELLARF